MIDWTKPLVVAGTDRVATVVSTDYAECTRTCFADWDGNGEGYLRKLGFDTPRLTNAPPTPKLGPEHIEALAEAIDDYGEWPHPHDEMKIARLAEIRAYLESL